MKNRSQRKMRNKRNEKLYAREIDAPGSIDVGFTAHGLASFLFNITY